MSESVYLAHHGVKGQKWGVRRYQNPDGTLTNEGRKRYGVVGKLVPANAKFKTSDIYAMEGAKRFGLLGGVVGKVVGRRQDKKQAKEENDKFFKEVDDLEKNLVYDFNVLDRKKTLNQNVKDTKTQLLDICDLDHIRDKLAEVQDRAFGRAELSIAKDSPTFARNLALQINDRFDIDRTFDQHMDEWVMGYENGSISEKNFRKHYEAELNDWAAWVIDAYDSKDLRKVAESLGDGSSDISQKDDYRTYMKERGIVSTSQFRSSSLGSKEPASDFMSRLSNDPYYITVKDRSSSGSGGKALVNVENKATAAVSLSYLGYSNVEIASLLGMSIEQLKKIT